MNALPERTSYWNSLDERQHAVDELFNRGAEHYDRACSVLAFGSGQRYRREALARGGVRRGLKVLDVGIGTGLLAREIATLVGTDGSVVGIDPAAAMLGVARRRLRLPLVRGGGDSLPFADRSFDAVTMGYALRHVSDLTRTFREFRRVLRPGGRVLVLEITKPRSRVGAAAARVYFGAIVPWLTRIATGSADGAALMRFYWQTIALCVPPSAIVGAMRESGLDAPRRTIAYSIFSEYTATRV